MKKIFHVRSEFLALRTLTETTNTKKVGSMMTALNPDSFHLKTTREIYNRVTTVAKKRGVIISWDDLGSDPALSDAARDAIILFKKKPLQSSEKIERLISRLTEYRQLRYMFRMAKNVEERLKGSSVDPAELMDESSKYITLARTQNNSAKWFTNIGAPKDKSGLDLVKRTLNVSTAEYIPTGFPSYDSRSIGIPRGTFMLNATQTGGGKCLVSSSIVPTSRGMLSLKDLWHMKQESLGQGFYKLPKTYVVTHNNDKKQAVAIYKNKGKTWKIKTSTGNTLEGLPEHKLWTINTNGNFDFFQIDSLKVGQWLPKSNATHIFDKPYKKVKKQDTNPTSTGWINYLPVSGSVRKIILAIEKAIIGHTYDKSYVNKKGTLVHQQTPYRLNTIVNGLVIKKTLHKDTMSRYIVQQMLNNIYASPLSKVLLKNKIIRREIAKIKRIMQYEWCQITHSATTNKVKPVYDLFVEDDHSYHVNGLIGHNTVMAGQLADQMATQGAKVCLVPLEMSDIENEQRQLARVSNTPMESILRAGNLSKLEKRRIKKCYRKFANKIHNNGGLLSYCIPDDDMTMEELLLTLKPYGYDVIIIDYVGLLKGVDGDDQWRALGKATRFAKRFATATKTIVMAFAQLSTENIIRYSKTMQEHANAAWFWKYDDMVKESGLVCIQQPKSRNQQNFDFYLRPDFAYMRFVSLTRKEEKEIEDAKRNPANDNSEEQKKRQKEAKAPKKEFREIRRDKPKLKYFA